MTLRAFGASAAESCVGTGPRSGTDRLADAAGMFEAEPAEPAGKSDDESEQAATTTARHTTLVQDANPAMRLRSRETIFMSTSTNAIPWWE